MSSTFQPQSQINSSDKQINPAGDPAYKPVKQMFGYICAIVLVIMTIFNILGSLTGILSATMISSFVKDTVLPFMKTIVTEDATSAFKDDLLEKLASIESLFDGQKLFWFFVINLISVVLDLYFYGMILAYPDYCGGNPEFYKAWPLIVSSALLASSLGVFHYSLILANLLPGLMSFTVRYFAYFGHDSSSDNCCLVCLCLKPWVYKKIDDFEAPSYTKG